MTKTTGYLGELEQMVLLAILQLDDQAYGTNVMNELLLTWATWSMS